MLQVPRSETAAAPAPASRNAPFGYDDYSGFQQRVQAKTGIMLSRYRSEQMRWRLATLALKTGCRSFRAYAQLIEHDTHSLSDLLDRITINVTELLRNPNRFEELVKYILPGLFASRRGLPLTAWSAGCSYGAEPYTLALLLHEIHPTLNHRILGTDLDPLMLAKAAKPSFIKADMINISQQRRDTHFHEFSGGYEPRSHLKARVHFRRHDLLLGPYPKDEYDLILCRNVVIYFTDEAKDGVYNGLYEALRPGGVLFLGATERIANHRSTGYELVRPFFYKKPL